MNMKMTMNIWNNLIELLKQDKYPNEYLRIVLKRWQELLGEKSNLPNSRKRLELLLENTVINLKHSYEQRGNSFLLEILRCMLTENFFNSEALNKLLKDNNLPYCYIIKESSLQEGEFKKMNKVQPTRKKQKYDCIFISHSYHDRKIVDKFITLLEDMGLKDEIFYTSIPEYGVKIGENIADRIKKEFTNKKVFVIFMLSKNYYDSVMCMHEMGAAWVLQHEYFCFLLPGYTYKEIEKGAIDIGKIGIKLNGDPSEIQERFIEFRNYIQKKFKLNKMDERKWNRKLNEFIDAIKTIEVQEE